MRSSVAAQDQRRNVDRRRPVALVGEPHGFGADAIGGGLDARHRVHHLGAHFGIGWLGKQQVDACVGHGARSALPASDRS